MTATAPGPVERLLSTARGYVARGWTQGALAKDARGERVAAAHEAAQCWCIHGALMRALAMLGRDGVEQRHYVRALIRMRQSVGQNELLAWNDADVRTQQDVLAAFDHAISLEPDQ